MRDVYEQRYLALKDWLFHHGAVRFIQVPRSDSEPFAMGRTFFGETFEDAVDTLPEPEVKEINA